MNNKHQTNKTIIKTKQCLTSFIPAAKWRGDDFLPAVSLALTLWWLTSFFTLFRSPFLQASNRSLPGSLAWEGDDESFWSNDRLVAIFIHLLTRNIGQTRDLKFKGKRLEDIDCLHRGWYQSTTCKVKYCTCDSQLPTLMYVLLFRFEYSSYMFLLYFSIYKCHSMYHWYKYALIKLHHLHE